MPNVVKKSQSAVSLPNHEIDAYATQHTMATHQAPYSQVSVLCMEALPNLHQSCASAAGHHTIAYIPECAVTGS